MEAAVQQFEAAWMGEGGGNPGPLLEVERGADELVAVAGGPQAEAHIVGHVQMLIHAVAQKPSVVLVLGRPGVDAPNQTKLLPRCPGWHKP